MSIASMADLQVDSGNPNKGTATALINSLATWIPTEAVAGYVAVQAVLPDIERKSGTAVCTASNFAPRWWLFGVMLALTLLLTVVYYYLKVQSHREWKPQDQLKSSLLPKRAMLLSGSAFALWAFALPNSPFQQLCGVESWQRTLAIVAGTSVLGGLGLLWHISPAGGNDDGKDQDGPAAEAMGGGETESPS